MNISRVGNQYMQAKKPWVLVKGTDEEKIQGGTVIGICVNIAYLLSLLIYPYMPNVSATIRKQLNLPAFDVIKDQDSLEKYDSSNIKSDVFSYPIFADRFYQFLPEGHQIGVAAPLFKRIAEADAKAWKEKFGGVRDAAKAAAEEAPKKSKNQLNKERKAAQKAAAAAAGGAIADPEPVSAEKTEEK